jgi:hypothetical protein
MGDSKPEHPQEDFEIEIEDLDKPGTTTRSTKLLRPVPLPRFSPCLRKVQLVVTALIVMLAILLILVSTAPIRELIGGIATGPTPTPAPTLAPGVDLFYILADPAWGYLSIDGRVVSHLPAITIQPPLRLSRGQHKLTWRADPFSTQSCSLTVPHDFGKDTCHLNRSIQLSTQLNASILIFTESLNTLSATERARLIQATQEALDKKQSSDIVQPGELYALTSQISRSQNNPCRLVAQEVICFAAAKEPLRATLHFQLETDSSPNSPCSITGSCDIDGQDCRLFCDNSLLEGPIFSPAIQGWNVITIIRTNWDYVAMDGRVIVHNEADSFVGGTENYHFVSLNISRDSSGWHVSPLFPDAQAPFGDPMCDSALQDAQGLTGGFMLNNVSVPYQYQPASGPNLAHGCLIVITAQPELPGTTSTPTALSPPTAYCLHRFGVLLAANDEAHRQWPYLPVADAQEQQLARQLAA